MGGSVSVGIENPMLGQAVACKGESAVEISGGRAKDGWGTSGVFSYVQWGYVLLQALY